MVRGYYTAASGLITQEKKLNAHANNIANVSTAGYKKDNLIAGTFGEHMAIRMDAYSRYGKETDIGPGVYMQVIDSKYTDYTQGTFQETARTLDFALQGNGFFLIEDAQGNAYLTRDGQFGLDEEGYLILPGFGRVQGENGDIEIGVSDFTVDSQGYIFLPPEEEGEESTEVGRLMIVAPDDYANLEKSATGLFEVGNYTQITGTNEFAIRQFYLEKSNVDMTEEMTRMIASQRALQSASQLVRMYDEMNQKSTEQLGRLR